MLLTKEPSHYPFHQPMAKLAYAFLNLTGSLLLSLGTICDADCSAVLTKHDLRVYNSSDQAAYSPGTSDSDGLWDVSIPSSLQSPSLTPVAAFPSAMTNQSQNWSRISILVAAAPPNPLFSAPSGMEISPPNPRLKKVSLPCILNILVPPILI